MKNKLMLLLIVFLIPLVSSATYYVTDPDNCPSSDGTNFPGQNCAPQDICGDSSGIAQCYDTSTISAPVGSSTTTGTGGTDYSCSDATCSGGFITNCYASIDSGAPYCDNNGAFLVDRNATCYNKHTQTTATGEVFAASTCSATCTTNYFQCDGSTTDADGCEINAGASCGAGTGTIVLNQCYSASAGNCTSSTRLDCNNDDSDSNSATCNGADGCEILIGGACTVGSLSGTYASTCSGGAGVCQVSKSYFQTGTNVAYQTSGAEQFLWGTDYGTGNLINMNNTNFGIWSLNASGCIIWMDGTSTCTNPTSSGGGGWQPNNATENNNYNTTGNVTADWFFGKLNISNVQNFLFNYNQSDSIWHYNMTTPAINDINNRFWNRTQTWNITQLYNITQIDSFNASWTSTYNSTYNIWAYNQTQSQYYYNQTVLYTNGTGILLNNNKFNLSTSYTDTLYAPISVTGDNSSWNQSFANTLYASIIWNYNQTTPFTNWLSTFVYNYNQTISETDPIFLTENTSLWTEAKNKFNSTYNNILNQQCPSGKVVNGTLINGTFVCITPTAIETDPIFLAENISLWNEAKNKFNSTYATWLPNYTLFSPFWYNMTTPAITDINSRFWNITQSWNRTQLYNITEINSFNASWTSTYNSTYAGLIGNVSYLNNNTNIAFLNNTQTFTAQQNFSHNITINQRICFDATCSQYIYSNSTSLIIQG